MQSPKNASVFSVLTCCFLSTTFAVAQDSPFSSFNKLAYGQMKMWILASADKMPEANYSYKPTDSIRSFGQIIGHVADAQYMFCSTALGEKNPAPKVEQTKTTKADLIAGLKDAFAYCDPVYASMTDASAHQTVKLFEMDMPKPVVLTVNDMHLSEHYGNIVTYLRLKNIVPPSSDQSAQAQAK